MMRQVSTPSGAVGALYRVMSDESLCSLFLAFQADRLVAMDRIESTSVDFCNGRIDLIQRILFERGVPLPGPS